MAHQSISPTITELLLSAFNSGCLRGSTPPSPSNARHASTVASVKTNSQEGHEDAIVTVVEGDGRGKWHRNAYAYGITPPVRRPCKVRVSPRNFDSPGSPSALRMRGTRQTPRRQLGEEHEKVAKGSATPTPEA
ncbi:hypothetical protein D9619_013365 [Psilocybe cf. subviscida]|uniref:Uncharacterized protein n=1 Tax=Psilocybe cf. subviscida TaxID=2480587 RepID=A0A8H5F9J5_9AGAR|nr:hypothetical protein D9619_013365 [Psilocybe cf. subviscida]